MTEEMDACPLRPLAVIEDGSSQSLLIVPAARLWVGAADISNSGRVGYPVLPISITEEEEPPAKPSRRRRRRRSPFRRPPRHRRRGDHRAAAARTAAAGGRRGGGGGAAAADAVGADRGAVAAARGVGRARIERDADSMPTKVSLSDGAVAWQGDVPDGANSTRRVTVRLIDEAAWGAAQPPRAHARARVRLLPLHEGRPVRRCLHRVGGLRGHGKGGE